MELSRLTNARVYWWPVFGILIGYLAWSVGSYQFWLIALPYFWATAPTRLSGYFVWLAYYLTGAREIPEIVSTFFGGLAIAHYGPVIWIVHAMVLAAPWAITWTKRATPAGWLVRTTISLILGTFPPIGLIGWLSPILAAGDLFPGMAWLGIAEIFAVLGCSAALAVMARRPRILGVVICLVLSAYANSTFDQPKSPRDWVGIDTELGKYPYEGTTLSQLQYQQKLIAVVENAIKENPGMVLVFPESVAGKWTDSVKAVWKNTDHLAAENGALLLVGADIPVTHGKFVDGIVVLGTEHGYMANRIPMPIGVWAPWSDDTALADPLGDGIFEVRGTRFALSVCFEDYLVFPMLTSAPRVPSNLVSMVNNWFFHEQMASGWIQKKSIDQLGRNFGISIVRVVNRPAVR